MIAPPVGIIPKKFWDERRMYELAQAVWRYTEAGLPVPQEWVDEYNDLAYPALVVKQCKHCRRLLKGNGTPGYWVHAEGFQSGKHRCDSADSGLPYGYEAETADDPCSIACLGSLDNQPRVC